MEPKVFVVAQDPSSRIVRYPSGVSGRELLQKAHQVFGLGAVDNGQGFTVSQRLSVVPDGTYTFLPYQSGDIDEAATAFWQNFRQISMSSGTIAALPENPMSLLPYREPAFYVRPVYCKLWNIISTWAGGVPRFLITGTPGVGKTSMLLFTLWNLARADYNIVLEVCDQGIKRRLIRGGKVYTGQGCAFETELSSPDCWYLCDDTVPVQASARTVLTTSIDNFAVTRFEKLHALTLYMPPWHWDEVQAAIPVYPHNGKALAEQLFKQYGGIASAVLARGHLPAPFSPLQSALSTANPSPILQQVGGPCRKGLSHFLTHMNPNEDFTGHHVEFASDYVKQAVTEAFIKAILADLQAMLPADELINSNSSAV